MCTIRKVDKLALGKDYIIWFDAQKKMLVKLIQPTEKGYNFLNLETSKCIFKYHLYPSKYEKHIKDNETWFFLNSLLKIRNA